MTTTTTLEDLQLSPAEAAAEAGEAAAARERELGADRDAVQTAYERAHDEALIEAESKAEELRQEAGEPVGEMPKPESPGVMAAPDKLIVSGTSQAKRNWKGKRPESVTLRIRGMAIEVADGDFEKGERIHFTGEAVVISESATDKLDPTTKTVVEAVQEHTAVVLDIELQDE